MIHVDRDGRELSIAAGAGAQRDSPTQSECIATPALADLLNDPEVCRRVGLTIAKAAQGRRVGSQ
jgi:hypothetical protein